MITKIDPIRKSTPFKARIDKGLVTKMAEGSKQLSSGAIDSFCKVLEEVNNDVSFNAGGTLMDINFRVRNSKNLLQVNLKDLVDASTPDELLRKITPQKIEDAVSNIILSKDKSLTEMEGSFNAKGKKWYENVDQWGVERGSAAAKRVEGSDMMYYHKLYLTNFSPKALDNMAIVAKTEDIDFKLNLIEPQNAESVKIMVASDRYRKEGSSSLDFYEYCDVKDVETKFTPEQIEEFIQTQVERDKEISNKLKSFILK